MKISTKGRYALRFLLELAEGKGEHIRLKDIAEKQMISEKYLEQISAALVRAGIIRGARGVRGGYRLVKEPKDYTVLTILSVTEGSLAPVACLDDEENLCQRQGECKTLSFWEGLYDVVSSYLSSFTLQDLLDKGKD